MLFSFDKYENAGDAAALKQRIESGEDQLCRCRIAVFHMPKRSRGGDLGTFKKGAMVPEFDTCVFDEATPLGDAAVQGPIKTQFGFHNQVYERTEKSS